MKKNEKEELIKDCTEKMCIDIDNIPLNVAFEIGEIIGNLLLGLGLKFEYGGIGEGSSEKICGIQFDVK